MSTWALLHEGKLKQFLEHEKALWPFRDNSWNIPNSPGLPFNNHSLQDSKRFAYWVLLLHFFFGLLLQSWTQLALTLCNQSTGMEVPSALPCFHFLLRLSSLLQAQAGFYTQFGPSI